MVWARCRSGDERYSDWPGRLEYMGRDPKEDPYRLERSESYISRPREMERCVLTLDTYRLKRFDEMK